jgi:hypothetical protein
MASQEMNLSINDMLFVALVRDFESMAMVGFGKLVDPVSQSAERNLERAKVAIDMIGMLEEKTKGNLNDTEVALLQQVLTNLRLNYVDELEKEKAEKSREVQAEGKAEAPTESPPDPGTKTKAKAKAKPRSRKKTAGSKSAEGKKGGAGE